MSQALSDLSTITQGRQSVEEYTNNFNLIRARGRITDPGLVALIEGYYVQGLNSDIIGFVVDAETLPEGIEAYQEKARDLEMITNVTRRWQ